MEKRLALGNTGFKWDAFKWPADSSMRENDASQRDPERHRLDLEFLSGELMRHNEKNAKSFLEGFSWKLYFLHSQFMRLQILNDYGLT